MIGFNPLFYSTIANESKKYIENWNEIEYDVNVIIWWHATCHLLEYTYLFLE